MHGGDAAHRHHGGKMIEADDRVTEAGQHAFAEGRRDPAAHHMMGKRIAGAERQGQEDLNRGA